MAKNKESSLKQEAKNNAFSSHTPHDPAAEPLSPQLHLEQLLLGLQELEDKAVQYNLLAQQIYDTEQQCLKELTRQRSLVLAFLKDQQKQASNPQIQSISNQEKDSLLRRLQDVEYNFPYPAGLILRLALGPNAPVILRPLKRRLTYKKDYEIFKLYMTLASLVIVVTCLVTHGNRILDAVYEFFILYYYCTLVLREHILVVNGSRIRRWWFGHHYLSIILSGVVLIWPQSSNYQKFRPMFLWFCLFLCMLQYLQYRYQRKRLYALVALDKARPMDTVIGDGVPSQAVDREFMVLTPFLIIGQLWQIVISYRLFEMHVFDPLNCEWQVLAVSALFGILGCGNILVTAKTIFSKRSAVFSLANRSASPKPAFASFKKSK
ncbi:hypothetical protein BDV3_000993 [Batrachochytrium dendrobatidis]|uniref:TMPIT-like protein n=1 Tax=Batrachochytrium dendrobatidis (strain JEL423) TaxID=403673 RepID=A0A177W7Z3_BATDL|nr:hypothetical protein BDEG_20015 [Batrachochytrium dendrobatidis JEL423]